MSIGGGTAEPATLLWTKVNYNRDMSCGRRVQVVMVVVLLGAASSVFAEDREALDRAQKLAWSKHFAEAERIYRDVLQSTPDSREASLGLARVLLWEGRYRDARERFLTLGDREGAATAAYWQGDFRTAAREFRMIDSTFARDSLNAIEQASRGSDRVALDYDDDNQPLHSLRAMVSSSFFSDPLTRWDVSAGNHSISAPRFDAHRQLPFAAVQNETTLPWQRLTITTFAGAQRHPDGSTRPTGGLTLRYRTSSASSLSGTIDHRELLTNDTALHTHPSITRLLVTWTRYADNSWFAGLTTGSLRYFDHNSGHYTEGYALVPLQRGFFAGASGAIRDTADNRFYVDAISGTRAGDAFQYGYRGSFTPYWTPKHLREVRAIVMFTRGRWKAQVERGIAHDDATAFGPLTGSSPLPANIFAFQYRRTSHPSRGMITYAMPIRAAYRFECTIERTTTAFYAANEIHASLVRRR